jgi:hypothetical protein
MPLTRVDGSLITGTISSSVLANSNVATILANGTIIEYSANIASDYTITAGKNALSAGPITINDSITVTIPDNTNWTIV